MTPGGGRGRTSLAVNMRKAAGRVVTSSFSPFNVNMISLLSFGRRTNRMSPGGGFWGRLCL